MVWSRKSVLRWSGARLGVLVSGLLMIGSCIAPLPVYERPPFWSDPGGLNFIEIGRSHKSEVAAGLGAPDIHRADGGVWVYAEGQTRGIVLSGGGGGPLIAEHLLVIAFDRANLVAARGVFQDSRGCLLSGDCFITYWRDSTEVEQFGMSARHGVLPRAMDFYAISADIDPFAAPEDTCRLLLYAEPEAGRGLVQLLSSDQNTVLRWWIVGAPYLLQDDLAPGTYRLTLSVKDADFASPWAPADAATEPVELVCAAGHTQVYRHSEVSGFWSAGVSQLLESVALDTAHAEVTGLIPVHQPSDTGWLAVKPYSGEQP